MLKTTIPIKDKKHLMDEYNKILEFIKVNNYDFNIFSNMIRKYIDLFIEMESKYSLRDLNDKNTLDIYTDDDAECLELDEAYKYKHVK